MPKCKLFKHGMTISPAGAARPCCAIRPTYGNSVRFEDTVVWKQKFKELEDRMELGWIPECAECKLGEEQNGHSLRTDSNSFISEDAEGIIYWDLKINNTCNLACRMCDSWSSSTWEQLVKQNAGVFPHDIIPSDSRWHRNVNEMLPYLLDAKTIKFTGGEPFLIPHVKTIINYLVETEASHIMDLKITSNGTQDFTDWIDKLSQFKTTRVLFSLDAAGERFEYIRAGASWQQVSDNILKLRELTKNKNIEFRITALPQALNVNHLDDLRDWCAANKLPFSLSPPVIKPAHMAPGALTDPVLRSQLIEYMKTLDAIHGTDYRKFIDE